MSTAPHLFVFDMDSTFIKEEVIDLLASHAGVGEQVAQVTERSMRGELGFIQSLTHRVALLAGLDANSLVAIRQEIHFSDGAVELVEVLHSKGHKVAVVSGGFINVIEPILKGAGVDFIRANTLEVQAGMLTGKVIGPVIDKFAKAEALKEYAKLLNIPLENTVAIGDGANDLEMMAIAGTSIAFNAKPIVQAAAQYSINDGDLLKVAELVAL